MVENKLEVDGEAREAFVMRRVRTDLATKIHLKIGVYYFT